MSSRRTSHTAMRTGGKRRPELPTNTEPRIQRELHGRPKRKLERMEKIDNGTPAETREDASGESNSSPGGSRDTPLGGNNDDSYNCRRFPKRVGKKREEVAMPSWPQVAAKKKSKRRPPGEYEVEKIVAVRYKREFCVKWWGYPEEDNTWEPEEVLVGASGAIDVFDRGYDAARRKRTRTLEKDKKQQRKKAAKAAEGKAKASRSGTSANGK